MVLKPTRGTRYPIDSGRVKQAATKTRAEDVKETLCGRFFPEIFGYSSMDISYSCLGEKVVSIRAPDGIDRAGWRSRLT
jgi:hypothetical protein